MDPVLPCCWPVQGARAMPHASEVRSVGPDHVFTSCLILKDYSRDNRHTHENACAHGDRHRDP